MSMARAWAVALVMVSSPLVAQSSVSLVTLATYANYETAGVVVTVSGDGEEDSSVSLEIRPSGAPSYQAAHPLVRVDSTHFVGSLFWLTPDTDYDVRVTLSDPDGVSGPATDTTSLTTRDDTLVEPNLRTLYVSPIGSDGNPGTDPGAPLATIQKAASLSQAGDLILIAAGVYRESVTVPGSGTAGQPIVFRGDGAGVILDGADQAIAEGVAWTDEGANVYSRVTGFPTGHVVSDQGRLYRYGSLVELQGLAAGAPGGFFFDSGPQRLYVKFSDSSSPAARQMYVARFENGFYLDGRSFVRLENLEIRHFGSGDYGKGVYLRYSSDCAVLDSDIHEVGKTGVWIKGGSRNRIEGNEIWDSSIFDWPWDETKGSSAENTAIYMTDDVGRGNVVRGNRVHGLFNGIGPCGGSAPPTGFTNETDVYDNELWEHTDDALEPEGHCANVRIFGNRIDDVHMAFALAPAAVGPVFLVRNTVTGIGNTRTSQVDGYVASALKINSGSPTPIGPLFLYHNTLTTEAAGTDAVWLDDGGVGTSITARNNVFAGTRYVLDKQNTLVLDWDWDLLYTTDVSRFVKWEGTPYTTLAALQGGTGQELNGLAAEPGLVEEPDGSLVPGTGSLLIDRGVSIPGINDAYSGSAPDIGAGETSGGELIFVDGFESGNTSAWEVGWSRPGEAAGVGREPASAVDPR